MKYQQNPHPQVPPLSNGSTLSELATREIGAVAHNSCV